MPDAHRFSSRSKFAVLIAGALSLAGCSGQARKHNVLPPPPVQAQAQALTLPASPPAGGPVQIKPISQAADTTHKTAAGKADIDEKSDTATTANTEAPNPKVEAASSHIVPAATPKTSAWCRYIDARAEARNALLLSPTVSASIDDDERTTAKLSYDIIDIARAKLEKESARASCQRYDAAGRIARMVFITPQSLTYAGNLAKADYLNSKRPTLQRLSAKIDGHVKKGDMTAQLAAGLRQYIETVRSQEYHARSEAHRRQTVGLLSAGDVRGLDVRLTEAERALQQVDRLSRSLEAVSVNVTAGVSRDSRDDSEIFDDDSAYAKVSVSYRIGALSPRRARYERIAEEARVEALNEYSHGSLWRTAEMASAIARARHGLEVQRDRVLAAIGEAKGNAKKFARGYEIELYQSKYRAQVDVIKLTAELRGIEATISDMHKVERNLKFQ